MEEMDLKESQIAKGTGGELHEGLREGAIRCCLEKGHIFELSTRSAEGALWVLCS